MGVKATHPEYDKFSPKWKRVRDVICGQDAIHTAGKVYLPRLKDEDDADYKARVCRSDFFNGTWRTIDALGGMAFRKPPTVDVPKGIEAYFADITLAGMSMEDFAKEVLEEALSLTRYGVLVDRPTPTMTADGRYLLDEVGNVMSEAMQIARGDRPTMQLYPTESIRNWRYSRINNAWVLSMVTLGEKFEVPKDEFESEWIDRYRVLDLDEGGNYRQRVFEVKDEKDILVEGPFYPLMNGKPLRSIPFKMPQLDEPPLIDLVDKNLAHYQVNSDYRHGGHYTALPTLFLAGVTDELGPDGKPKQIYIGGSAAVTSQHPEARGEFIEYKGQGLGALERMLDRIERQMALLGARMIADESQQAETLGATQIKRAGENSVLAKIVQSVSELIEGALTIFAEWAEKRGEIVYQINRDFLPAMMDAQTLTAIFAGVQSGNISQQEAFELLQRGDVIDGQKDYETHAAEIEISTPSPARPDPAKKPDPEAAAA